ncbi:MAG: VOC family protein [Chitinispirillia bacterium]|nr:VOC family protein [Chitinispirillia bacterium]
MAVKLVNICPVFLTDDVMKTTDFYVNKLGFKYAKHFDKIDNFAAIYRDSIEIIIVQKRKGEVESNIKKYGNGYDAYIDTDTFDGINELFIEYKQNGVKIIKEPSMTDYGNLEFVFEDIDGRNIGIGLIANKDTFFKDSNYI